VALVISLVGRDERGRFVELKIKLKGLFRDLLCYRLFLYFSNIYSYRDSGLSLAALSFFHRAW
jgi:hypothetical protein